MVSSAMLLAVFAFVCGLADSLPRRAVFVCGHTRESAIAAGELQRYLYELTDVAPPILDLTKLAQFPSDLDEAVMVSTPACMNMTTEIGEWCRESLHGVHERVGVQPESHSLRTVPHDSGTNVFICAGSSPLTALHASYSFIESLGVRFQMPGHIIPSAARIVARDRLPAIHLDMTPAFAVRGLQPFHDFPEGPDWWTADTYKQIESAISKMKMNFIGLHTYPLREPAVWTGVQADIGEGTKVLQSYNASWSNNERGDWGYFSKPTSLYTDGAAQLFPSDCYGVFNSGSLCPFPATAADSNNLFQLAGDMLGDAFRWAHQVGVKTCVGTEIPMTKPNPGVSKQAYYEGIFARIMQSYPIDFYWLWTPEAWEWSKVSIHDPVVADAVDDLNAAQAAWQVVPNNFSMATCGWVLGPLGDRPYLDSVLPTTWSMSSIDMQVGWEAVDPSYANVTKHDKWVIPWMEDDPGLSGLQLWVNRTLEHARDATRYNAVGLLGIHWRTREISPTIMAMAQYSWNSSLTSHDFWVDYCTASFGAQVAVEAAAVFDSIDSFLTPRPIGWRNGPGAIVKSSVNDLARYNFADTFADLRSKVTDPAELERFDWWLANMQYIRQVRMVGLAWALHDQAITKLRTMNGSSQLAYARDVVLPLRIELANNWTAMLTTHMMSIVDSTGAMGTIMNHEQESKPLIFLPEDRQYLESLLGSLPAEADPAIPYQGSISRIIVPTVRDIVNKDELYHIDARILSSVNATSMSMFMRPLGSGSFQEISVTRLVPDRSVWLTDAPAQNSSFEWYLSATLSTAELIRFPPSGLVSVVVV